MIITTKYFGPTDTKGARIIATCKFGGKTRRETIPYGYGNARDEHAWAATCLAIRLGADVAAQPWARSETSLHSWAFMPAKDSPPLTKRANR